MKLACEICRRRFHSKEAYEDHCNSAAHQGKRDRLELMKEQKKNSMHKIASFAQQN